MKKKAFIEGQKIYLRPYNCDDDEMILYGKNKTEVREALFLFAPYTSEHLSKEINELNNSKESILLTICKHEDNIAIGQTAFVRIDYISRAAVYYIAIYNPQYWSKGYGKETTRLMVKYAFDTLNLNRIQLHVSCTNKYAIESYKKAGFKQEGILREAMYLNNKYVDFMLMGIIRKDYYTTNNSLSS